MPGLVKSHLTLEARRLTQMEVHMLAVAIIVIGRIDSEWCEWLGGLSISDYGQTMSMLSGVVQDQAAVYGIIARMRDFCFQVYSVRIEIIPEDNEENR
jgi:hypothetical protein